MAVTELTRAYNLLNPIIRFDHPRLPTRMYHDSVGTHTVNVYSRVNLFHERYPKPNNIDWGYAVSLAIHHDEHELHAGDEVAFTLESPLQKRKAQIRRTAELLGQPPKIADMVIGFEKTTDMLRKSEPIRPRRREEILVATMDLISGADIFHLETVRQRNVERYKKFLPLPKEALVYAPKMLLQSRTKIPLMTNDAVFVERITHEIDAILGMIVGWWSVVPRKEIPRPMRKALRQVVNVTRVRSRHGEAFVF